MPQFNSTTPSDRRKAAEPLRLPQTAVGPALHAAMGQASGHFAAKALFAVVRLGVPDAIGAASLSVAEIAARLDGGSAVRQDLLLRLMRLLSRTGVFAESTDDGGATPKYSLTDVGAVLQTGVGGQPSVACGVEHLLERPYWDALGEVPDYVSGRPSKSPFIEANGTSIFD